MAPSYREIDYRLRPAKHVERKMLCDAFPRLEVFGRLTTYRYIGFGSIYFADFDLFHKRLGFTDMVSIERSLHDKSRFALNKPYRCIEILSGESTDVLPTLNWDKRCIVWLDYDGKLTEAVIADTQLCCRKLESGSLLLVTVNVEPYLERKVNVLDEEGVETGEVKTESSLDQFADSIGRDHVPGGLENKDLAGPAFLGTCRRVLKNAVEDALAVKNGTRPPGAKISANQVFLFRYSDDARMMTVGWVIVHEGDEESLARSGIDRLPYSMVGDEPFHIAVPKLTPREIRHLNEQLPKQPGQPLDRKGIPDADIEKYQKIYRYFPNYFEALDV